MRIQYLSYLKFWPFPSSYTWLSHPWDLQSLGHLIWDYSVTFAVWVTTAQFPLECLCNGFSMNFQWCGFHIVLWRQERTIWLWPILDFKRPWLNSTLDSGVYFACAELSVEVSHCHVFPFISRNRLEALTMRNLVRTVLCLEIFLSSGTRTRRHTTTFYGLLLFWWLLQCIHKFSKAGLIFYDICHFGSILLHRKCTIFIQNVQFPH